MLIADLRLVRADQKVAREQQFETACQRIPLNHRDDGQGRFLDLDERVAQLCVEQQVGSHVTDHPVFVEVLEVDTGREGLAAGPADDDGLDRFVGGRAVQACREPIQYRGTQGVHRLGAIDRHVRDHVADLIQNDRLGFSGSFRGCGHISFPRFG